MSDLPHHPQAHSPETRLSSEASPWASGPCVLTDLQVREALRHPPQTASQKRSLPPVGGKALGLARTQEAGMPVPRWLVILPQGIEMGAEHDSPSLRSNTREALHTLLASVPYKDGSRFSVRSSALAEDGAQDSFAGMLDSVLNVTVAELDGAMAQVARSAFSPRLQEYCKARNLPCPTTPPAIIIQEMVEAQSAGVAFSVHPTTMERDIVLINAVHGLGEALVSGEITGDSYEVDIHYRIRHPSAPNSILTPQQCEAVARLCRQWAAYTGVPQDMEWAIDNTGKLHLLQARPITTLTPVHLSDLGRMHTQWNRSTMAESWPSPVTPLTASVAQVVVGSMYAALTQYTTLPKIPVENLLPHCWTLTGYGQSRLFLNETRLNALWFQAPTLRYRLDQLRQGPLTLRLGLWWIHGRKVIPTLLRLWWEHTRLDRTIAAFHTTVDTCLNRIPAPPGLDALTSQELMDQMDGLLHIFHHHWKGPGLTHFFAAWGHDNLTAQGVTLPPQAAPSLVTTMTEAQNRLVHHLSELPFVQTTLAKGGMEDIESTLQEQPTFHREVEAFLRRFGCRGPEDLTLEASTLKDDPVPWLRTLAQLTQLTQVAPTSLPEAEPTRDTSSNSFSNVPLRLRGLARVTAKRIAQREAMRYRVSEIMDALRQLSRALGDRLSIQLGWDDPTDVFYLTLEELRALIMGYATPLSSEGWAATLRERRHHFKTHQNQPDPPATFLSIGPAGERMDTLDQLAQRSRSTAPPPQGNGTADAPWTGTLIYPTPPGQPVTAAVAWADDPTLSAESVQGKILISKTGHPGLVMWYPLIAGLIIEEGSLLSHAAIVAREMRVPTLIQVSGLSEHLPRDPSLTLTVSGNTITRESQSPSP